MAILDMPVQEIKLVSCLDKLRSRVCKKPKFLSDCLGVFKQEPRTSNQE